MKIEKSTTGGIIIKKEDDTIFQIVKTAPYLQAHPREEGAILISATPTNQDESEGIVLRAEAISKVDGEAFTGDRNALMLALDLLFNVGGGTGEGVTIDYPFIDKGYAKLTLDNIIARNSKRITGNGINDSRMVRPVDVNGTTEYWAVGHSMHPIRYDENLNRIGIMAMHGTAAKTNNRIQFVHDFIVDYTNDKIYFVSLSRHVVRVFRFSTIRDGGFVLGNYGEGGHLYDIGAENPNNNYWVVTNTTERGETGRLHSPFGIAINPINGNIIISNISGYVANQTIGYGFVGEYSPQDGTYVRTLMQYNGSPTTGGISGTSVRHPRGMAIIDHKLHVICNSLNIVIIELNNPAASPFVITNFPNNYDNIKYKFNSSYLTEDNGRLLVSTIWSGEIQRNKNGLVLLDQGYSVIGQAGNKSESNDPYSPYGLSSAFGACNVGDRGLELGDWYIVCNNDEICLVTLGIPSDGSYGIEHETFYEIPAMIDNPIPEGWSVVSDHLYQNGKLIVPQLEVMLTDDVFINIRKN